MTNNGSINMAEEMVSSMNEGKIDTMDEYVPTEYAAHGEHHDQQQQQKQAYDPVNFSTTHSQGEEKHEEVIGPAVETIDERLYCLYHPSAVSVKSEPSPEVNNNNENSLP